MILCILYSFFVTLVPSMVFIDIRSLTNLSLMKYIIVLLTLFSALLLFSVDVNAQWTNVAPNKLYELPWPAWTGMPVECGAIHFKDGTIWAGWEELCYSEDTGKTWQKTNFIDVSGSGLILDIEFFDKNTGAISTWENKYNGFGPVAQLGIFLTYDRGKTWQRVTNEFPFTRIGFSKEINPRLLAFMGSSAGNCPSFFRHASGKRWDYMTIWGAGPGYSFITAKSGTLYSLSSDPFTNDTGYVHFSTDEGISWTRFTAPVDQYGSSFNPNIDIDSCDPQRLYLTNCAVPIGCLRTIPDDTSQIFYSTNAGKTWEVGFAHQGAYISGGFASATHAQYAQTVSDGILRSTDKGVSWKTIGGPSSVNRYSARHLCAVNDNIIFALDSLGSIWATYNSGGDPVVGSSVVSSKYSLTLPKGVIEKRHDSAAVIPIYLKRTEPLPALEFYIRYADNDYTYVGTYTRTGISVDVASGSTVGIAKVRFPGSSLIPDGDSLIGYSLIKLKAFEPFCSMVYFDSARFDNNSGSCEGQPVITGTQLYLGNYYGCGGIMESISDAPSAIQNFSVYPNPAGNTIMLESTVDVGDLVLEMRDQLGKTIISRHEHLQASSPIPFDVSSLPKGIYYLRIDHDGKIVTKKIAISR